MDLYSFDNLITDFYFLQKKVVFSKIKNVLDFAIKNPDYNQNIDNKRRYSQKKNKDIKKKYVKAILTIVMFKLKLH